MLITQQAKQLIESCHQHGENEQLHSEYKTVLDKERPPSGKFAANALIMLLGMIAFNTVRICSQESLIAISEQKQADEPLTIYRKPGVFRRRIRSELLDIMYLAFYVTSSSRYTWMSFGCHCPPLSGVFKWLYQEFSAPAVHFNGFEAGNDPVEGRGAVIAAQVELREADGGVHVCQLRFDVVAEIPDGSVHLPMKGGFFPGAELARIVFGRGKAHYVLQAAGNR